MLRILQVVEMQCNVVPHGGKQLIKSPNARNFEVFHLVVKHCVECLTLLLKQNDFRRRN